MLHNELLATLRLLTPEEKKKLKWFVQSPYFFQGKVPEKEGQLIDLILKALSKGDAAVERLMPQAIHKQIFGSGAFVEQTVHNLGSSAMKVVRQFIIAEIGLRQEREIGNNTRLLRYFSEKGVPELAKKYFQKLEQLTPGKNSNDEWDYWHIKEAADAKQLYRVLQVELKGDVGFMESIQALDHFFLVKRLTLLLALFNLHSMTPILADGEEEAFLAEIDQWADKPFFQDPVVQLGRKALDLFYYKEEQAEQAFASFMDLFRKYEKSLSLFYLRYYESLAYNFCMKWMRLKPYRELAIELFHRRLLPERQKPDETITCVDFLSLLKMAVYNREYELAEQFLENYRNRITGRHPSEEYYQFGLAFYYYEIGKYDEARKIIVQSPVTEAYYKYFGKALEIKIFYAYGLEEAERVEDLLNNLKVTVSREHYLGKVMIAQNRNLANFGLRLNRLRCEPKPDKEKLRQLLSDVENEVPMSERRWLLQQIRQLLEEK